MPRPPDFKQSALTQQVYEMFVHASNADPPVVTWDLLTERTGLPRTALYSTIQTVLRRMVSDQGVVFENEANFGYRVVPDDGLAEVGQKSIERARRQQRTGVRKMDCADMSNLTPEQRVRHITRKTVLELGLAASRPKSIKSVEQSVNRRHNQLTPEEQIAAIREALIPKK